MRVTLRDGAQVVVRPVRAADAPYLVDGFARLSPRSRRARFLTTKQRLSAKELRYFTDVDHYDHEALCAYSRTDGSGIAIARYVRDATDRQSAEVAVTVVDDWQHKGVGSQLMMLLTARARLVDIRRFKAVVAADNRAAIGLARKLGDGHLVSVDAGVAEYEFALPSGRCEHRTNWSTYRRRRVI